MSGLVVEAGSGLMQFHSVLDQNGGELDYVLWVRPVERRMRTKATCTNPDHAFFAVEMNHLPPPKTGTEWPEMNPNHEYIVCACNGHLIE